MSRPRIAGPLVLAIGLLAAAPPGLRAQTDPATQQIIERLTPVTRGIRVPGAGDAPAQPPAASPVQPGAPVAATPTPPASVAPPPPPPPATAMAPVAPRETTAPSGVAAISLAVYFPSGSWALTPQAEQALIPLARALNAPQLVQYRVRIEGHTDTVGDPRANQLLSERRAATVRA